MTTLLRMKIEEWPIDKPIPYARNARTISPETVDKVAASIQEFGFRQPIVVDRDDVIIVGHTRLLAARKLNLKTVPVHIAKEMSPTQVKAYRLMDNRSAQDAKWNFELVATDLSELKAMDFNLGLTGFEAYEIGPLLAADWDPASGVGDETFDSHARNASHANLFEVTPEQHQDICRAIAALRSMEKAELSDGEALQRICLLYLAGLTQ